MAEGVRKDEEFSGAKPVEERHRIDEMRLDAWMRDHVEGYQGPLVVLQFKGGQSNPTYRIDTPARSYVMRRRRLRRCGACARLRLDAHHAPRGRPGRGAQSRHCQT